MTDNNVRVELKKLAITFAAIMIFYVAVYVVESRTHFLIKLLQ